MNLKVYQAFLLSLAISLVVGYVLMLTGIWYTLIAAGLVAAVIVRKGWLIAVLSSFVSGLTVTGILMLQLPLGNEMATLNAVGSAAGISSSILIALMFLVSATLLASGGLIGSISSSFSKATAHQDGP